MSQLDGLKEQLAYLRLWLGMLAVAVVSARDYWHHLARPSGPSAPSADRAPHRGHSESIDMDLVVGIVMLAVVLLFVGIALHAARKK
jgi:hypothetical protein